MREQHSSTKKLAAKYDRLCLNLSEEEVEQKIKNGEKYVVRMLIPEGETSFKDFIHGKVTIKNSTLDDQIIMKSDGYPTYHLANIVDDHMMKITHVIRGEEWLPSTPKHLILYNMLALESPKFGHLPLIVNEKG